MVVELNATDLSQIEQFYTGKNVFITGATGFMGKILLEKLLRTCNGIDKVYILIREKKGKEPQKRLEDLLNNVIYERLKQEQPNVIDKLVIITGDCSESNLGMKEEDTQTLIKNIQCVIHCAATVRFDDHIRKAVNINVRATRDILRLARQMENLKSIIHVSTAFSHCVKKDIDEKFYDVPITGEKLINLMDLLDDKILADVTPVLIGDWPNTYVFTKAVAENVVQVEGKGLPVAMVRPAIVVGCMKEPIPGFNDNPFGATGVFLGAALGVLRTLHCDPDCLADLIPADYLINCTIAAAWYTAANMESLENGARTEETEKDIPIYNYVSSVQKPITWRRITSIAEKHLKQVPSQHQVWHYCFTLNPNYYIHMIYVIFLHHLPAYLIDFILWCVGKEQMLVKGYKKIDKFMNVLSYFSTQQWHFQNNHTQTLWSRLNREDKKKFEFNLSTFDWDAAFHEYARGGRIYLLKDPLDTLPQGRRKYLKLQIAHYILVGLLLLGISKLFMVLWNAFI